MLFQILQPTAPSSPPVSSPSFENSAFPQSFNYHETFFVLQTLKNSHRFTLERHTKVNNTVGAKHTYILILLFSCKTKEDLEADIQINFREDF